MHKTFILCAVSAFAMTPVFASDKTDVIGIVHKWGSTGSNAAVDNCADDAAIMDAIPPYEWHGSGACTKWLNDFEAFTKQNGITDAHAVVGKARYIEVTADRAYVVAPITYFYKMSGKEVKELATWSFALQKGASGWRITGWAYSPQHQ